MRAIVTRAFSGVKDGQVMPQEFGKGDMIHGELAAAAVRFRDAKETEESIAERKTLDAEAESTQQEIDAAIAAEKKGGSPT